MKFSGYRTVVKRILPVLLLPLFAHAQLSLTESEHAVTVTDGRDSVVRFSIEADADTGRSDVRIMNVYDPFGDPYAGLGKDVLEGWALDWGVRYCRIGTRELGPYWGPGAHRQFERWSYQEVLDDRVTLDLQRAWIDPDDGHAFILETASVVVHAEAFQRRAIDLRVRFVNVSDAIVVLPRAAAPGNGGIVTKVDFNRPSGAYRDSNNDLRTRPGSVSGPWLSAASTSPFRMQPVGLALFNHPENTGALEARFGMFDDGRINLMLPDDDLVLVPGDYVEWNTQLFCFADDLSAKAIDEPYRFMLTRMR